MKSRHLYYTHVRHMLLYNHTYVRTYVHVWNVEHVVVCVYSFNGMVETRKQFGLYIIQ